jgi:hypothetical protein
MITSVEYVLSFTPGVGRSTLPTYIVTFHESGFFPAREAIFKDKRFNVKKSE